MMSSSNSKRQKRDRPGNTSQHVPDPPAVDCFEYAFNELTPHNFETVIAGRDSVWYLGQLHLAINYNNFNRRSWERYSDTWLAVCSLSSQSMMI